MCIWGGRYLVIRMFSAWAIAVVRVTCISIATVFHVGTEVAYHDSLICASGVITTEKLLKKQTKLRGLSPRANYTDRAAAAGRRS